MTFQRTLIAACAAGLMATTAFAMTPAEHKAAKESISADYKMNKQKCDALKANAKDICVKEAKGAEDVAKAELEAQYKPSAKASQKVAEARADAAYAVAKEKCDDLKGNQKDVCVKEAKATRDKALADTKMVKKEADARADDRDTKRDADYKVAAEKCDAMSGDAKSTCVNNAKVQYGKK